MAGASTTKEAVNEIVDKLKSFVIEWNIRNHWL
jgi:hypothetical protein